MAVIDRHPSTGLTRANAFWRLWLLGMAGAAAVAFEPLPTNLVHASGFPELAMRIFSFSNTGLLLAALVGLGVLAAPRVGLRSHIAPLPTKFTHEDEPTHHWVQAAVIMAAALITARLGLELWKSIISAPSIQSK
jgi:hypothetical protein